VIRLLQSSKVADKKALQEVSPVQYWKVTTCYTLIVIMRWVATVFRGHGHEPRSLRERRAWASSPIKYSMCDMLPEESEVCYAQK
jgi:hypothetical protein